jgi:diadenosine tetraphosphatase ApaH/serine/threonine PP2A family protein phosphatase
MSRNIFIGDVHGCLEELEKLVEKVDPGPTDTLVSLGDLIHKGPDSSGVLDFWKSYDVCTKILICGNHEEKHARWLRRQREQERGGKKNKMQHVEEYPNTGITEARELTIRNSWLSKKVGNTWAVHAGIPGNFKRPPEELDHDTWLALSGKQRKQLGPVLRVRFETLDGKMIALGKNTPGDPFWAEQYDGRFGTVVFGHNPFMLDRPAIFPHAYGIDLGCVHGGYLCALVEENGIYSYETVKAKTVHKQRPVWLYE